MDVGLTIRDLSLRQAVRLTGWENGLVRDTIRILDEADLELEARISRAIEDHAAADTIRRLRDIHAELRGVNLQAYREAGRHLTSELKELGARVGGSTADLMESALPFAFSFTRPAPALLRSIITSRPFQGDLIGPHIDKLASNRLQALTAQMEQGLVQGDSLSQILIRVRGRKARGRFVGGVLDAGNVGRPALEGLVRTATAHVQTMAQQGLYEANSDLVRGVVWVATLDHRTCPKICQPRDGRAWEYDPKSGAYKPFNHGLSFLGGPGRSHWRDRCTSIAWLRNLDAFEAAGADTAKLTSGERAAMGGPVPVSETFASWIPKQPREIQELALGKRRAAQLRRGVPLDEIWQSFQARSVAPVAISQALPLPPGPRDIVGSRAELEALRDIVAENEDVFDLEVRAAAKDRVADDLAARMAAGRPDLYADARRAGADARKYVDSWAKSSGDSNPAAVALQMAAQEEFGLDAALGHFPGEIVEHARAILGKEGSRMRAFLRAEYEATQKWLADSGLDSLTLVRGANYSSVEIGKSKMALQPVSSFAADMETATEFGDYLHVARVPASAILSTARTGAGCLKEFEILVLGRILEGFTARNTSPTSFLNRFVNGRW